MIDLWYLNTKSVNEQQLSLLLKQLPVSQADQILRFRNHEDRRVKVFARLIIEAYFRNAGFDFNWAFWMQALNGKPYLKEADKKFSISHSGEYALVAFSDLEVGADIEAVSAFGVSDLSHYFHNEEKYYILNASDSNNAFFRLWTRKEAYLKASGKGIVDGLHNESCLQNVVDKDGTWHLYSPSFISGYHIALCTQINNCNINTRELFPKDFYTKINSETV